MSTTNTTYQQLLEHQKQTALVGSIAQVLEWDERTYLPQRGGDYRALQLSYLAGLQHRMATDRRVDEWLIELDKGEKFPVGSAEVVNIREWRRDYNKAVRLPSEFVEELTHTSILSQRHWVEARKSKDFGKFKPWLQKTVELKQREAQFLGWEDEPYDALLDTYEPGAKTKDVATVLSSLRDQLIPMVAAVQASAKKPNKAIIRQHFPVAAQEAFAKEVVSAFGFKFESGRLDQTTHPFCSGLGPDDVRITTRYEEHFLNPALFGVMHEAGHGIYDQYLPREHYGTPRGWAVSLGIHESQSRFWENFIGRSKPFWECWLPKAQEIFPALKGVSLDDFYFAINEVTPSFIRVEADEMTYNLHILLRFELERDLVNGRLSVDDVPDAWNAKFKDYFGLTVPDDSLGCLQDIHWSAGYIGYFPTYSLGNLNAAQLFAQMRRDIPAMDDLVRNGNYAPLREWLTDRVHQHGKTYSSAELIAHATGRPLNSDALVDYLKNKFGGLYGF